MTTDALCDRAMFEISVAHDEDRPLDETVQRHVVECPQCSRFAAQVENLDPVLAVGHFERAPDVADRVIDEITRPRRAWWSVAAVVLVGLLAGALVGVVSTRIDVGQASDLGELFHESAADVDGLTADLVVVERGVHESVPERVYTGELHYAAPEELSIALVDTTDYDDEAWLPNDVALAISDGDMVSTSGSPCPVAALPDCLVGPMTAALTDQPPFDDGVQIPLEIVGPGRSLAWPSGIEVLGTTEVDGQPAIQVRSTVAAVELIGAITGKGAWRELHPTDPVVMWLDEQTLVPLRIEVFAADSAERELWQLRRGYDDRPGNTPIFIIELSDLDFEAGKVEIEVPSDAPSRGFVDGEVDLPRPDLPDGFETHRSGNWLTADGGQVETASWSDGRSWLMVEVARGWDEPRLFGLSLPFIEQIDLGAGSVGYLSPAGDAVAIHGEDGEVLVTGSISTEDLIKVATSLGMAGLEVPSTWLEAATVAIDEMPAETLIPEVEGWSILGRVDGQLTTVLMTGSGARSVIITQSPGDRLDPPTGPDFSEVDVRGTNGRHDLGSSTLEWIEDGRIVRMRSETVAVEEMLEIAETMEPR